MSAATAPARMTAPAKRHSPALAPLLLVTFATGVLDAATYLGLHGVFTANMTGNVVFIGLGLAGHDGVPLLRSALALGGFLLGAALIGRLGRRRPARPPNDGLAAWTLLAIAAVVCATTAVLGLAEASVAVLDALTVVLAGAMGAQAVAARRIGVPDVTTVVVTSTLALLAADHHLAGRTRDRHATQRRLGAVLAMLLGSVAGALLLRWHLAAAVGLCGALLLVAAVVCLVRARRQSSVTATN